MEGDSEINDGDWWEMNFQMIALIHIELRMTNYFGNLIIKLVCHHLI